MLRATLRLGLVIGLVTQLAMALPAWPAHPGDASASPLLPVTRQQPGETREELAARCSDRFEYVSDPKCTFLGPAEMSPGVRDDFIQLTRKLNNPGECVVAASLVGLDPGASVAACAAREVAVEQATERVWTDALSDPNWKETTIAGVDVNTFEGCKVYAQAMPLGNADIATICATRMARIAENEANRALATVQAVSTQHAAASQEQRATCQQLKARADEMLAAMFTPKYAQMGGDAELRWIDSQLKELNCKAVLGQP